MPDKDSHREPVDEMDALFYYSDNPESASSLSIPANRSSVSKENSRDPVGRDFPSRYEFARRIAKDVCNIPGARGWGNMDSQEQKQAQDAVYRRLSEIQDK